MTAAALAPAAEAVAARAAAPVAVIDLGSNSVRLVVFDGPPRAPVPKFNEKVLCGLGRRLVETGRLDEDGMVLASDALRRFAALARLMQAQDIRVVATAAVRDAANGRAFVADVERRCGLSVRVLAGREEAELSALGVLSGIPDADGVMGDLGGASLELVALNKGAIGDSDTLPLGPFRLTRLGDYDKVRDHVDAELKSLKWIAKAGGKRLYLVGGAWRSIARVHMAQTDYPLRVIHHYALPRRPAEDLARLLARQGKESLARIAGVSRRRLDSLAPAALVLRRLIKLVEPEAVVFSAYGLRDGLCFAGLPEAIRREDALLASCRSAAVCESRFAEHGDELFQFTAPLFERESAADKRLRLAACLLSDIGWRVHPDHRGEQTFGRVLHAAFAAIDHPGRAFLALAVFARYAGSVDEPVTKPARQLLDAVAIERARILGLALRLGHTLTGGVAGVLTEARLRAASPQLTLELPGATEALMGETVQRRLEALARALGRDPVVRSGGRGR